MIAQISCRFSFTLATLGASGGSYGGVNSLGSEVVQAVRGSSLNYYVINLMTMDYGSASSSVCVVKEPRQSPSLSLGTA